MKQFLFFLFIGIICIQDQYGQEHNDTISYDLINLQVDLIDSIGLSKAKRWRIGLQNGLSYMWESTSGFENKMIADGADPEDIDQFYKQFHRGYLVSVDIHRLFCNKWGAGVRYSIMSSFAEKFMTITPPDDIEIINSNIRSREFVNFVGVSLFGQQWFRKAASLHLNTAVYAGYVRYRSEFETDFSNQYFKTNKLNTSNSFGGGIDIGAEYFPIDWMSIGLGFGCFLSKLNHIYTTYDTVYKEKIKLTDNDRKNISRFDFFVGVRFYIK